MNGPDIYLQIECVKREIAMRRRLYPKLIARDKMNATQAEAELKTMSAVLETLEAIAAPELPLP